MSDFTIPLAVSGRLTPDVAREIAAVYQDRAVYPDRIVVDTPDDLDRLFPRWPTPVLHIMTENQGVCVWGVPLDSLHPVVVTCDALVGAVWQETTRVHAPSMEHFIAARRWDQVCLYREPHLWAQADVLDDESLAYLRAHFEEVLPTTAFPAPTTHRFQDGTSMVMLWSGEHGCEWRISSSDMGALEGLTSDLLGLSNLRRELWCGHEAGEALLDRLRAK
ncbi:MAG TPA: hypothetical protein VFC19_06635 [Candidatus Limnocylindrales bacterium]|nr:hypothetical protein [Candidatus Limnocylindrales bacterium]